MSPLKRFALTTLIGWSMLGLYMVIDLRASPKAAVVTMPAWVPFWPGSIPFYWAMLLATWLLPVAIRDAGRFRACLWAMLIGWFLVWPWWLLTPTTLPRPLLPHGLWAGAVRDLWALDPPNNVMPCAHGVGPTVAVWFVGRERPAWRWPSAVLLLLSLPSIALTWQHRPIDILLGVVAAAVGIAVVEAFEFRRVVISKSSPGRGQ